MNRLFVILSLVVIFSCKEKSDSELITAEPEKKNILEGLTFSVDTGMVDTGEELINFGIPLISGLSPDARYYYILNYKTLQLQKIDLDSLKLIETFILEKDGPNSPGFTYTFQPLSKGRFFFPHSLRPSILHESGEKIRSWNLNLGDIIKGLPVEPGTVTNRIILDPILDQLYSLPTNYETREYYLAFLDSIGERKKILELPEFQKANRFTIRTGGGEGGGLKIELPFLQHINGQILISCTVGNGIYIFDPNMDSLSYREFPLAEFKASELEVFLMAFSKDLELIGETKIEGLPIVPPVSFFKDGKLWSYVNVEDELGFAVMDFNFDN